MDSFEHYLQRAAASGDLVNLTFDRHIYAQVALVDRLARILETSGIPYEVTGGLAVFLHVHRCNPDLARASREIDFLLKSKDRDRLLAAIESTAFGYRQSSDLEFLLYETDLSRTLTLHCEDRNFNDPTPVRASIYGSEFWITPVPDLLQRTLTAFRLIDQVHTQDLDAAALIGPAMRADLPPNLESRLDQIRDST